MANNDVWDEDDDGDLIYDEEPHQSNSIRQLRNHSKKIEKQLAQATARLAEYEAKERKRSIQSVLTEKGYNPKIAAFIPADVEDVEKWLGEYGDVFGAPAQQQAAESPQQLGQQVPTGGMVFTQEDLAAMGAMDRAEDGGQPAASAADVAARIAGAKDEAELMAFLRSSGVTGSL